jgi:hypothetical protein
MSEQFELDIRKLHELIEQQQALVGTQAEIDIETLVVGYTDEPKLHDARPTVLLAWFAYLLGTSGCVTMPEGFGGHGLIGVAGEGPRHEDEFIIEVMHDGLPPVSTRGSVAMALMGESSELEGPPEIEAIAKAIVAEASELIPAAKAAAAAR